MLFGHLLLVARVDMEAVKLAVVICPWGVLSYGFIESLGVFCDVRGLKKGERISTNHYLAHSYFQFCQLL